MEKVKVINKKTGAVKEIKKALAGDYIGTGEFEMYEEKKQINKQENKPEINVNRKERLNVRY